MLIKFKNHSPKLGQNVFVAEGAKICKGYFKKNM